MDVNCGRELGAVVSVWVDMDVGILLDFPREELHYGRRVKESGTEEKTH